jgi:hypothetical protein
MAVCAFKNIDKEHPFSVEKRVNKTKHSSKMPLICKFLNNRLLSETGNNNINGNTSNHSTLNIHV